MANSCNVKLIGLDLDGTTLGRDRALTQRTVDALAFAAKHGAYPAIVSGRQFMVVPEEIRVLSYMRYFVLCNGATIYDKQEDKVLYQAEMPLSDALKVYDSLVECDEVYLDCYHSDGSWARAEDYDRIDEFVSDQSHRDVLYNTRTPMRDFRKALIERNKPIQKLQTIYMNSRIRDEQMERIRAMYPQFIVTSAYTYNMEINVPQATKGLGLMKLAQLLGIERGQVIAFGDGCNDISMIENAGTGYAMGNADPAVKAVADKIAPPNTEDGVAQILECLFGD